MSYYRRRLPHWDQDNASIFITWRLHGTLPAPRPEWLRLPEGHRFVAEDRALDRAPGPHHLTNPAVAKVVADALHYGAETLHLYDLHAWVIMSNHVHVWIDAHVELSRITGSIKGFTARQANAILGRTHEPSWALESYDHWVRSLKEFENIIRYIEFNPVKAGLVASPEYYPWSSAGLEARVTEEVNSHA